MHTSKHKRIKHFTSVQTTTNVHFTQISPLPKKKTNPDLITLPDLFISDGINNEKAVSALFLVFGFSMETLHPLLRDNIKITVMADPSITDYRILEEAKEAYPNRLRVLWAQKETGVDSAFHPKLYLIRFKRMLRVVIGSANLFKADWESWSNVIWYKDLLFKSKGSKGTTEFDSFITECLGKSYNTITKFLKLELDRFDFREIKVEPVLSTPFQLRPKDKEKVKESVLRGLPQLRAIMTRRPPYKKFKLKTMKIYYSSSSIGGVDFGFVYQFVTAVAPYLAEKDYILNYEDQKKFYRVIRLVYPTQGYVQTINNPNTKCLLFSEYLYNKVKFDKNMLYSFENNESVYNDRNFVSHSKVFVVTHNSNIDDDTVIYIGSHNFTKAAWGKFSKGEYKVVNYEMGVLFPPGKDSRVEKERIIEKLSFRIPTEKYDDYDTPFFSTVSS